MKGGMIYFGGVAVFILIVVMGAMYISGGFQSLQAGYGTAGVIGFVLVITLAVIAFMIYVRKSLQTGMPQSQSEKDKNDIN